MAALIPQLLRAVLQGAQRAMRAAEGTAGGGTGGAARPIRGQRVVGG